MLSSAEGRKGTRLLRAGIHCGPAPAFPAEILADAVRKKKTPKEVKLLGRKISGHKVQGRTIHGLDLIQSKRARFGGKPSGILPAAAKAFFRPDSETEDISGSFHAES